MDTYEKDQYLVAVECVEVELLACDVGRSEKWVKSRITRLKNCGAWDIIRHQQAAMGAFRAAYFTALKQEHYIDLNDIAIAKAKAALGSITSADFGAWRTEAK